MWQAALCTEGVMHFAVLFVGLLWICGGVCRLQWHFWKRLANLRYKKQAFSLKVAEIK